MFFKCSVFSLLSFVVKKNINSNLPVCLFLFCQWLFYLYIFRFMSVSIQCYISLSFFLCLFVFGIQFFYRSFHVCLSFVFISFIFFMSVCLSYSFPSSFMSVCRWHSIFLSLFSCLFVFRVQFLYLSFYVCLSFVFISFIFFMSVCLSYSFPSSFMSVCVSCSISLSFFLCLFVFRVQFLYLSFMSVLSIFLSLFSEKQSRWFVFWVWISKCVLVFSVFSVFFRFHVCVHYFRKFFYSRKEEKKKKQAKKEKKVEI
jgi:hypothetical protein